MVATSMHYLAGVLIAWFFGYKDNRKYWLGLLAIIPDLDGILIALLLAGKAIFGYSLGFLESNTTSVMIFAHRGLSHSISLSIAIILILFVFRIDRKIIALTGAALTSHLILDYLTAWKLFPFLPFSTSSHYLGLIEVFDPMTTFFTMAIFSLFAGITLLRKEKVIPLIFAYILVLIFGFFSSIVVREFNIQTIILSQALFWMIVGTCWIIARRKSKSFVKKHITFNTKGVTIISITILLYFSSLIVSQIGYAITVKTPIKNIEPLEEFAFNYNAHTFEIDEDDVYRIGIISLKGVDQEKTIPKITDTTNSISQEVVDDYFNAYSRSLHVNWFNHPVFTFYKDGNGIVYANIRYAKSFLDTEFIPGPQKGMNVTLKNGLLVQYGDSWFD